MQVSDALGVLTAIVVVAGLAVTFKDGGKGAGNVVSQSFNGFSRSVLAAQGMAAPGL